LSELHSLHDFKVAHTKDGQVGIVPLSTELEDVCCIVRRISNSPALRKTDGGYYNLVRASHSHDKAHDTKAKRLIGSGVLEETIII
jgi:hypothetical protein